jgi:hypothetical protein
MCVKGSEQAMMKARLLHVRPAIVIETTNNITFIGISVLHVLCTNVLKRETEEKLRGIKAEKERKQNKYI